jgi:ABC-type dipeptide/oligopeptide/nickel transport system permease subunit
MVAGAHQPPSTDRAKLLGPTLPQVRSQSPWRQALGRLLHHRAALFGGATLGALILIAIVGPTIAPYSDREIAGISLASPNAVNWMGTDALGRDIMSRVLFGARISLAVGLFSVAIGLVIGTVLGMIAGFYRGWVDTGASIIIDTMLAFPGILLAIAIISVLGPSLQNAMIAVGIGSFPAYARLVRGSVLSAREHVYVEAARVLGADNRIIMFRHVLPNVIAPVIVLSTLRVGTAILTAAGLSFLGLGAQPPTPEWGAMVNDGRNYLRVAWWVTAFPGVAIMITVLAVNQLGDGLRDALDPRGRQS